MNCQTKIVQTEKLEPDRTETNQFFFYLKDLFLSNIQHSLCYICQLLRLILLVIEIAICTVQLKTFFYIMYSKMCTFSVGYMRIFIISLRTAKRRFHFQTTVDLGSSNIFHIFEFSTFLAHETLRNSSSSVTVTLTPTSVVTLVTTLQDQTSWKPNNHWMKRKYTHCTKLLQSAFDAFCLRIASDCPLHYRDRNEQKKCTRHWDALVQKYSDSASLGKNFCLTVLNAENTFFAKPISEWVNRYIAQWKLMFSEMSGGICGP